MILPKTRNTGWSIGGGMVALMMILLAESSAPPPDETTTTGTNTGTNTATTVQKDFRPILQNIQTTPEHSPNDMTEYQTLLVWRLSGVPEPANGPMAILHQMEGVYTPYLDQFDISAVRIPAAWDADRLLEIIRQDPSVDFADREPETELHNVIPNDPDFEDQTNLHDPARDVDIDAPEAWAYTTGSDHVVVAVIDIDFDITNQDLFPNLWVNEIEQTGVAGMDDDNNGCRDDIHGCNLTNNPPDGLLKSGGNHGTAISSILGARGNDGFGMTGVAWNIRMMLVRGSFILASNYILKMRREKGVNIRAINYSIAPILPKCYPSRLTLSQQGERNILEQLRDEGIVFVQASGNDNINYGSQLTVPLKTPGCYDLNNIFVVGGQSRNARTRWSDSPTSGSAYGSVVVDLYAPAEDVPAWDSIGLGPQITLGSGTSDAAPHVAAAAALLWSYKPDLTVTEVRSALLDTVDRFDTFQELDLQGVLTDTVASGGALNIANALYSIAEPGIRIHSSQTTIAEGNSGYLDLSLTREPVRPSSGDVVILDGAAMTSPTAAATVTPASLTFTSADWHIPQRMSVRATGSSGSEVLLQVSVNRRHSTTDYRALPMRTATLTLQSDGARNTLTLPRRIVEGNTATATIRFSGPLIAPAQLAITATGAATAGADYTLPGPITVAANSTYTTFTIPTVDDEHYEPDETLSLHIAAAPSALPAPLQATLTIEDNDTPLITMALSPRAITQSSKTATAQTATATIALDRPAVSDVLFFLDARQRRGDMHLRNSISGDVWPTSATIVIEETSTRIVIHSIDEDDELQIDQTLRLFLELPAGAAARLGTPSAAYLRIVDDDGEPPHIDLRLRVFLEGAMTTQSFTSPAPDP